MTLGPMARTSSTRSGAPRGTGVTFMSLRPTGVAVPHKQVSEFLGEGAIGGHAPGQENQGDGGKQAVNFIDRSVVVGGDWGHNPQGNTGSRRV